MRSLFALLVAAVVVIGFAPVGAAAGATLDATPSPDVGVGPGPAQTTDNGTATADDGTATNTTESNGSAGTVAPGAQLAGVVAVQGVEVNSEVESRAFGQRVAAAATNDSKAEVVAGEVNESRKRLEDLRDRLAELEAAHEAGEISEGRYRAATAQTVAEINAIERRLEQSNETASQLPEQVREANGINTSNIERLRTEARNLTGPEVAEIARSIAGGNSGRAPGRGLGDAGPPGRSGATPGPGAPGGDAAGSPSGNGAGESPDAAGSGNAADRGTGGGSGAASGDDRAGGAGADGSENGAGSNGADDGSGDGVAAGSGDGEPAGSGSDDGSRSDGSPSQS